MAGARGPARACPPSPAATSSPPSALRSRCCFHFVTANRPGIWALVTGTLADNGINIESVHQKWEDRTLPSDLFVLVDEAQESQARRGAGGHPLPPPGIDDAFLLLPDPAGLKEKRCSSGD